MTYRIAIIGMGKIAHDQHVPVIAKNPNFELAGVVSQRGVRPPGVPVFALSRELYDKIRNLDAVAICTPPAVRHAIAREALAAGKHVLLEKPPTPTLAEPEYPFGLPVHPVLVLFWLILVVLLLVILARSLR